MRILPFVLFFVSTQLFSQSWDQCNVLNLNLDDLNVDYDFSGQSSSCGCTGGSFPPSSTGNCYLVNFSLTKTINGILEPKHVSRLSFSSPLTNPEPNHIQRDYIDIYNPSNCREYQSGSFFKHQYSFNAPAPPGGNILLLICPGSESGPMRGRFFADESAPEIAKATNVQASDGEVFIDISFTSIPGKYYMVYRNSDICNDAWEIVDGNSNWPMATSTQMTIRHQIGGTYGNQYNYRVVSSNSSFVVASGAKGEWSDPDLGYGGNLNQPFDASNSCPNVFPPPNCPQNYSGSNQLVGSVIINSDYETNGEIESIQTLGSLGSNGLTIDYDSQTSINLLGGFNVLNGVIFRAYIEGCGGNE